MVKGRRSLVRTELGVSWTEEFAEQQQAAFSACPEAHRFSDEEAEDFLLTALTCDFADEGDVGKALRKHGIAYPPELAYDTYRLGRHIFRRWADHQLRDLILNRVVGFSARECAAIIRRRMDAVMELVKDYFYAGGMAGLRRLGVGDMVGPAKAALSAEQMRQYQATLLYAKLKLHQFTTETEPARAPTRWEQQKLLRRLHLRQVQMHSLKRSLRRLRTERKALVGRLRHLQTEIPELRTLAEELEAVNTQRRALETSHAELLAQQQREHAAAIELLQTQLAAKRAGYARALALREHLLPAGGR